MPVIDYINQPNDVKIITWDIKESNEELLDYLQLNDQRMEKYSSLKPKQAREYLGLRACLKKLALDHDINYTLKGKPYLSTNTEISITHSHDKVAVGVSTHKIGIDIELHRPKKILNIKKKFVRPDENFWIEENNKIDYLHIIWGIKEGLYKINGGNLWNFLHHYRVESFHLTESQYINCWISDEVKSKKYMAFFKKIDAYFLIWVLDYP